MPKPPAELTLAVTNAVPCEEDKVPQTPITPVSAEGLMLLQNFILEKDAHALDETSKKSLERHVLKFTKAAQLSLTKGALQQNHIQFLMSDHKYRQQLSFAIRRTNRSARAAH